MVTKTKNTGNLSLKSPLADILPQISFKSTQRYSKLRYLIKLVLGDKQQKRTAPHPDLIQFASIRICADQ